MGQGLERREAETGEAKDKISVEKTFPAAPEIDWELIKVTEIEPLRYKTRGIWPKPTPL